MRKLTLVAVAALATAVPSLVAVAPVQAKPPKPRAELVAKGVTGSLADGKVTAKATVKNKGSLKAAASTAGFYLSLDAVKSTDDTALGTVPVGKIKPKKTKVASGVFTVATTVAPGTYRVIACADVAGVVKERKETNNCKAAPGSVVITPPAPTGPIAVSAVASPVAGGTVATSAVTGGTCQQTTCSFPTPGTGTVTFTPTANAGYRFGAWTGATCTGYTSGAGNKITFTNPTTAKACTATFILQVTISWTIAPIPLVVTGTVAGVASNGTCSSDPVTGAGSCVVDASVGTVALTGTAGVLPFKNWTGATCDGTAAANVMTFTAPAVDKTCVANFGP